MIASEKWNDLSPDEKSDLLREEIVEVRKNNRSLKKTLVALIDKLNEIRRHLGMKTGR